VRSDPAFWSLQARIGTVIPEWLVAASHFTSPNEGCGADGLVGSGWSCGWQLQARVASASPQQHFFA
jgi:hypothetical protein